MSISPSLWAWERDEELPGSEVQSDELCTKSKRWVHCLLTAPLHCHLLKHSQSVRSLILLTLHQTTLSNHYFFAWQYQIQLKLSFSWSTLENVVDFLLGEKRLKTGKTVCHTNSFNFLIIWDWKQAVWRESATKPLPIIKSCLCARGNACQNRKKKNVITESVPCWISLAVAIHPLFHVLKTLLSLLQPHACTKDSILCLHNSVDVIFLYWYGDCFSFQCIGKNHMWDVLALENEKTDCSGFSWIVSIMVNGFSKCQSSCFIDLASQRGEQTHLDGKLLTAKTAPCIHKLNQEEMWNPLCPFVIHILYPHIQSVTDHSHSHLDASQLLSEQLFTLEIWPADSLSHFLWLFFFTTSFLFLLSVTFVNVEILNVHYIGHYPRIISNFL